MARSAVPKNSESTTIPMVRITIIVAMSAAAFENSRAGGG
jgi:hypothetical protein